jgi:hypothetical protein
MAAFRTNCPLATGMSGSAPKETLDVKSGRIALPGDHNPGSCKVYHVVLCFLWLEGDKRLGALPCCNILLRSCNVVTSCRGGIGVVAIVPRRCSSPPPCCRHFEKHVSTSFCRVSMAAINLKPYLQTGSKGRDKRSAAAVEEEQALTRRRHGAHPMRLNMPPSA